MIKWFYYIVFVLIFIPQLSFSRFYHIYINNFKSNPNRDFYWEKILIDTNNTKGAKKPVQDEKGKIKEVTKTKKQPKPEKVEPAENAVVPKQKPKRQRRPEGLERPPEIPRRNGN